MTEDNKQKYAFAKTPGMTIPDGYFADFQSRMMQTIDTLPQPEATQEVKRSVWQTVKPYVYMAAMFCGIWLMMHMFTLMGFGDSSAPVSGDVFANASESDAYLYEYLSQEEGMSDYDLYDGLYNDGFEFADYE